MIIPPSTTDIALIAGGHDVNRTTKNGSVPVMCWGGENLTPSSLSGTGVARNYEELENWRRGSETFLFGFGHL